MLAEGCFSSTDVFLCLLRGKIGVLIPGKKDLTFSPGQATIQPLSEAEIAQLRNAVGRSFYTTGILQTHRNKWKHRTRQVLKSSEKYTIVLKSTTYYTMIHQKSALGAGCRRFESCHSDQTMIIRTTLSKLVMCSDYHFY